MWQFAVGLYLVELTPGSLRLTAVYQLVRTLVVILFGPFVGDWVDASPRLKGILYMYFVTCFCLFKDRLVGCFCLLFFKMPPLDNFYT